MAENFVGRKVVITGAVGVFGTELARAFADAGAVLCLSDLRTHALAALATDLGLENSRLVTHDRMKETAHEPLR